MKIFQGTSAGKSLYGKDTIMLHILIIATGKAEKLKSTAEKRGHSVTVAHPRDFTMYISDSTRGYDSVFYNDTKVNPKHWDIIITRIGYDREYTSKLLYHFEYNLGIPVLQSGVGLQICADKVKSAQIMSYTGIRVPKQIYTIDPKNIDFVIKKLGGLPVILKEIEGSKGKGIILLESVRQTNMTLESYYGSGKKIILQEFIDNGGKDERHIVVGDKIVCSMRRTAPKNDIRANLSLAGSGERITPSDEVRKMCIDAVKAIPGLNFAGVDIMIKTNPKTKEETPYFIEINANPGEMIIDITNHNYFDDLLLEAVNMIRRIDTGESKNTSSKYNYGGISIDRAIALYGSEAAFEFLAEAHRVCGTILAGSIKKKD